MDKITFSDHAKQRMFQRDINEETVIFILKNPDYVKTSFEGRKLAFKKLNGKDLTVIYIEKESYIKVITIY